MKRYILSEKNAAIILRKLKRRFHHNYQKLRYWYNGELIRSSFSEDCVVPSGLYALQVSYLTLYENRLQYLKGNRNLKVIQDNRDFEEFKWILYIDMDCASGLILSAGDIIEFHRSYVVFKRNIESKYDGEKNCIEIFYRTSRFIFNISKIVKRRRDEYLE